MNAVSNKNGDSRTVSKFFWIPTNMPTQHYGWKTKWLEFAKVVQQYWDGKWYDSHFVE